MSRPVGAALVLLLVAFVAAPLVALLIGLARSGGFHPDPCPRIPEACTAATPAGVGR